MLCAVLNMTSTIGIYVGLGQNNPSLTVSFALLKSFTIIPYVVFEYYLIMFEHLFVDSSHYQSTISSESFLDHGSPNMSVSSKKMASKRSVS